MKRTLGQFTPAQWDKDEWHPLLGPWRFIQVLSLCIVFLTVELNTFFLKFCLWIPPRNSVVIYRLILWWLLAIPTIREYNSYLQDRCIPMFSIYILSIECWWIPMLATSERVLDILCPYTVIFTESQWRRLEHIVGSLLPFALWNFWFALSLDTVRWSPAYKSLWYVTYLEVSIDYCWSHWLRTWWLFLLTGLYPKPMPIWLVIFWSSVGVAIVTFLLLWSWQIHRSLGNKKRR